LDEGEKLGVKQGKKLGLKEGIEEGMNLGLEEGYLVAKEGFDRAIKAVKTREKREVMEKPQMSGHLAVSPQNVWNFT
jgi:hypothetical protein